MELKLDLDLDLEPRVARVLSITPQSLGKQLNLQLWVTSHTALLLFPPCSPRQALKN